MPQYDSIIVGGGHNGLVCAAYLGRAGQRVLVLEAADGMGGLAATREFHPGFRVSVAHSLSHFSSRVAADLDLARHGYQGAGDAMPTLGLNLAGEHVRVHRGEVSGVSPDDARKYGDYLASMQRFAEALQPSWFKTMPRIGGNSLGELLDFAQLGIKLRLLGKADMLEFFRIAALPARDLMDENFDSELLKAALSWDGLVGSRQAPRSPNNTVLTMLYRMTGEHPGGAHSIPLDGMSSLVEALARSAAESGAELRCNAAVAKISIEAEEQGLRARGVHLEDGSALEANRVISAVDPKRTFLDLVGAENLEIEFANRIRRLRSDGMVAKLHLALDGVPEFTGIELPDARMIIAPDMDTIEFAYDDAKYGQLPGEPVMEVLLPSLRDPGLAAGGRQVLSAQVMYVPRELRAGWSEDALGKLKDRLIDILCRYAPGLRRQIVHAELLTPAILERDWRVTGGHWHHTEMALDQMLMMRPTYEAAQYSTPIPGLYLCGAGCHPGGDLVGGAGHNAAREILR